MCPNCGSTELHPDFPDETVCAKCNATRLPDDFEADDDGPLWSASGSANLSGDIAT